MNAAAVRLADEPHHDGSERYTRPGPHSLGDTIEVRLRVPDASRAERVRVRSTPDAEPRLVDARVERREHGATWWVADLLLHNPITTYRFLLEGGEIGYAWVNQAGTRRRDVSDSADFTIAVTHRPPSWLPGTIGYQVFLDRFAASGVERDAPSWAIPAAWGDDLESHPDLGTKQWFGGDLAGVESHLDHLQRIGVDLIYLTPFFPSRSSHRYDAASFDCVDPLLGGDDALVSMVAAAHQRGIRVIGDITLNHTGDGHDWFRSARHDPGAAERGYFMFDDATGPPTDTGYVAWHDVPSLPKLDHRSGHLADRLYRSDSSVIARYLDAPFQLDGWRVDCANTTGRWADIDLTHEVASATLDTIERHRPDGWLLAEHCYDAVDDLDGTGWHGVMAYQWFTRPIWSWLRGDRPYSMMSEIDVPMLDGVDVVTSIRELGATVPWAARAASMTMLDSHDSARFRSVVGGDGARHTLGMVALLTMPGVPTLFAGSEIGVEGDTMDTCRVPFPWHDEDAWDHELLTVVSTLTSMRRSSNALRSGSLRWIGATAESITYVREAADETVLVHLNRASTDQTEISADDLGVDAARLHAARTLFGSTPSVRASGVSLPGTAGATVLAI